MEIGYSSRIGVIRQLVGSAVLLAVLVSRPALAFSARSIGGSPGAAPKTAPKPMILFGLQRYEADRHGVYQMTTAISNDYPNGVALDAKGDLYVSNNGTNTIVIYPPGSGTGAVPSAMIAGPNAGLNGFGPMAVDPKGNLFTASSSLKLLIYAAGSTGDVAPASTISASATVLNDVVGMTVDAKDNIYVTNALGPTLNNQLTPGSIVIFGARSGPVPRATISGSGSGLITPVSIAVDSAGKIYVANDGSMAGDFGLGPDSSSIVVFRAGSSGNVRPIATISGAATALGQYVTGLALDAAGNIYVSSIVRTIPAKNRASLSHRPVPSPRSTPTYQLQIQVFAAGSNGNVAPLKTITGDATGLANWRGPNAIAVSPAGKVYVAGANSVIAFDPGSNGNVSPIAIISRGESGVKAPPMGVAFDRAGNIYALRVDSDTSDSIAVWPAGTTDGPPMRTISIPRPVNNTPLGLGVDAAGNVYVGIPPAGTSPIQSGGTLLEYVAGSEGNAQPARTISGAHTLIGLPTALTVDHAGNVYVSSWYNRGAVSIFSPTADGDAAPIQFLTGAATEISDPQSVAVDPKGTIYVGNDPGANPSVTVYGRGSTDDAAPQAVLRDRFAQGLGVDASGNLYVSDGSEVEVFPPGAGAKTKPRTVVSFTRGGRSFAIFPAAQP